MLLDLQSTDITGTALKWFSSYLQCRHQRVKHPGGHSEYHPVSSGVPQGTILGPILFNVYVRHLPHVASSFGCELPMFADDMTLYATSPSPSMATQVLTCALHALHTHLSELGLNVNMEKSSVMFVSKHPSPQLPPVTIGTSNLQVTHQARCLGVIITDNLSWSPHVDSIISKVCRKIGVLRRCFRQLSVRARCLYLLYLVRLIKMCVSLYL